MATPATKKSEIRERLVNRIDQRNVLDELGLRREIKEIESIPDVAEHARLKALAYAAADKAPLAMEQFEEAKYWDPRIAYVDYIAFLTRQSMMMEAHEQAREAYALLKRECGLVLLQSINAASFYAGDVRMLIDSANDLIVMKPDMKDLILENTTFAIETFDEFKKSTGTTSEQLTALLRHAYALLTEKHKRVVGVRSFYHHEESSSAIILEVAQVTPEELAELNFDLAYYLVDRDAVPENGVVVNYQMAAVDLSVMELQG